MILTLFRYLTVSMLLFFSGCAASTANKAIERGATNLSAEEIFTLVNNNTIHLVSSDFDARVFMTNDGKISAKSLLDSEDNGNWDITGDGTLCIRFSSWYYGDVKCYSVYQDAEQNDYLLFSENGSFAYTAAVTIGNSGNLKITGAKEKTTAFIRSSLRNKHATTLPPEEERPAFDDFIQGEKTVTASSEEIQQTVKEMAKDCPACNLENADLRLANLIGANLKGANLRGADLSRANLRRANLEGADLRNATLLSTNLPGANLKEADLSGADFTGSNLIQADLTDAAFDKTTLANTLLEGTKGLP